MSDLISRDEAVATVLGISIEYQLIYGKKEPKDGFVRSLIKRIANIPPQEEPSWIPVSDGLPEEHEWIGTKDFGTTISDEVYVTFEDPNGKRFCKHLSFHNGKPSPYDQMEIDAWHKGAIPIAWKPLPKPYQEANHE